MSEIHRADLVVPVRYEDNENSEGAYAALEVRAGGDVKLMFENYAIASRILDLIKLDALDSIEIRVLESETPNEIEEIDRNARAYGWEIAMGAPITDKPVPLSPSNPFGAVNWKEKII